MSQENGDEILEQLQRENQEWQCQTIKEELQTFWGMYFDPDIPSQTFEMIDAACSGIGAAFDSLPDISWEGVLEALEWWRTHKLGTATREGHVFLATLRHLEQIPASEQQQAWKAVRSLITDKLNNREVLPLKARRALRD
jgi:hypothetical protein